MRKRPGIGLAEVALRVGDTLRRAGIRAVLTGGACAHIRSGGVYASLDVDFVLVEPPAQKALDAAMAASGFRRSGEHYAHPEMDYIVEFPRGPLAIGGDHAIRPSVLKSGRLMTPALSATDSCRDRLAAFYHWNDRQALAAAIAIARNQRVAMKTIRDWSRAEGAADKCAEFEKSLARAKRRRAP